MTDRTNIQALDRINLRLSAETFHAIDEARAVRAGRLSRNTWIAEAIEEKLARDIQDVPGARQKRVSND